MAFRGYHFIGMLLVIALCNACYSFKGVSISSNVQTFYVDDFELAAPNAPITLNQDFGEALRDKIRTESRLSLTETDPDLIFSGSITAYNITALDPVVGERTALNRLQISIRVNYESTVESTVNEDDAWQQTFSFFAEFPADQNLTTIENQLIETIFEQITEDIFNRAFSNW